MLSLITTSDGSHTIRNDCTGDTYHSIHGAIQESQHIYIKNGVEYFTLSFPDKKNVRVLEVGFGTGLNALLTLQFTASRKLEVEYVTVEAFPLERDVYSQLNYPDKEVLNLLHECAWETPIALLPNFSFIKHQTEVQMMRLPFASFDVIYYDAFAPKSQPELWTKEMFEKIKFAMGTPSVLVTYCVKGTVKRELKELGLSIETPNGPPGKRSMLRARQL